MADDGEHILNFLEQIFHLSLVIDIGPKREEFSCTHGEDHRKEGVLGRSIISLSPSNAYMHIR